MVSQARFCNLQLLNVAGVKQDMFSIKPGALQQSQNNTRVEYLSSTSSVMVTSVWWSINSQKYKKSSELKVALYLVTILWHNC